MGGRTSDVFLSFLSVKKKKKKQKKKTKQNSLFGRRPCRRTTCRKSSSPKRKKLLIIQRPKRWESHDAGTGLRSPSYKIKKFPFSFLYIFFAQLDYMTLMANGRVVEYVTSCLTSDALELPNLNIFLFNSSIALHKWSLNSRLSSSF